MSKKFNIKSYEDFKFDDDMFIDDNIGETRMPSLKHKKIRYKNKIGTVISAGAIHSKFVAVKWDDTKKVDWIPMDDLDILNEMFDFDDYIFDDDNIPKTKKTNIKRGDRVIYKNKRTGTVEHVSTTSVVRWDDNNKRSWVLKKYLKLIHPQNEEFDFDDDMFDDVDVDETSHTDIETGDIIKMVNPMLGMPIGTKGVVMKVIRSKRAAYVVYKNGMSTLVGYDDVEKIGDPIKKDNRVKIGRRTGVVTDASLWSGSITVRIDGRPYRFFMSDVKKV